ncbi:MAG: Rdx family protein [Planctomycetota bacterium]
MPTASRLEAALKAAIPGIQVTLVGGGGGDFIVHKDNVKLWDKNADNSGFPDIEALVARIAGPG